MPEIHSYDYTFIRVVPRVEFGEFLNVGLLLFCRPLKFLDARFQLNNQKLHSLEPGINPKLIEKYLDTIQVICSGSQEAGYFSTLSQAERYHWLAGTRSTIIQTSPTHCGLTADPAKTLDAIFHRNF